MFKQKLYEINLVESGALNNLNEAGKVFLNQYSAIYDYCFSKKQARDRCKNFKSTRVTPGIKKATKA